MESSIRERLSLVAAIGCGIAFGVSGVYQYFVTNRQMTEQIHSLSETVEDLKNEVKELRAASMAASQSHSPIHSQLFHFEANADGSDAYINRLNCSRDDHYSINRCQIDGQLTAPPVDSSVTTDDNEEFFDFTEGETESELNVSMNLDSKNSLDINLDNNHQKNDNSFDVLLRRFDGLLEDSSVNKKYLYQQMLETHSNYGNNAEIMWRTAKATHLYGISAQKESNKELMKRLAFETLDYAKKAIELDPNNAECHKWYAIAIGSLSDHITTKEKISNGNQFKKHLDIALGLKPNDPSLHHMLGRFCYEVSSLSWVERKLASALFSKVPESSFDDSLSHFMKACDLRPEWKENILFISKILMSQKKHSEAIKWIDKGLAIKTVGEDDVIAHQQLDLLNTKVSKYK